MKYLHRFCVLALVGLAASPGIADSGTGRLADECASPQAAWVWCDDFERDRSADYFEGTVSRLPGKGVQGSTAAAFTFTANTDDAGALRTAFGRTPGKYFRPVDAGTRDYREIYWRMFVFHPQDWAGNGADKLSRAMIISGDNWSQAMIAHVWSGGDPGETSEYLYIDPASGTDAAGRLMTTGYNEFDKLRWLGARRSDFPVFAKQQFGKWHCIEAHVRLNDPGRDNGVFRLFINDTLQAQRLTLNWVGQYNSYGINAVFFENFWNAGSPVTQTRYFDNLVISTQRIGCQPG